MRRGQLKAVAIVPLVAGLLAGCGGGGGKAAGAATPAPGKVVQGATETGMKLKVESFVPPKSDPLLKQLEAYRAAAGYPPVDYHRVSADAAQMPDRPRVLTFAASPNDLSVGKGIETRFGCDVISYEWIPTPKVSDSTFNKLRRSLCTVPPAEPESIAAGAHVVYYLVTDRGFAERGLRSKRIFGPLDAELR